MSKIIRSRAPVRISFAGGGTDVSPFTEEYGGAVLNAAIDRYAYSTLSLHDADTIELSSEDFGEHIELKSKDEVKAKGKLTLARAVVNHFRKTIPNGCSLKTYCELPPRSGLGSSASVFVSAIGTFNSLSNKNTLDAYDIAELAYDLERNELKNVGGRQDQYAAVFGGINFIEFKGDNFVRVNPITLKRDILLELESNLLLIYLGGRKTSGDIIKDQLKNIRTQTDTLSAMQETKQLAYESKYALLGGKLKEFGQLLNYGWDLKKRFSKSISNSEIDDLYIKLKQKGIVGGKITGAGGGGHMILYCKPGSKHSIITFLKSHNIYEVPFSFDFTGLTVWEANSF